MYDPLQVRFLTVSFLLMSSVIRTSSPVLRWPDKGARVSWKLNDAPGLRGEVQVRTNLTQGASKFLVVERMFAASVPLTVRCFTQGLRAPVTLPLQQLPMDALPGMPWPAVIWQLQAYRSAGTMSLGKERGQRNGEHSILQFFSYFGFL
jgi:hypothetical protein